MDKTCGTCRFWDDGECRKVNQLDRHSSDKPDLSANRFEIEFKVSDDTGLDIVLQTGPDFGCNRHEE